MLLEEDSYISAADYKLQDPTGSYYSTLPRTKFMFVKVTLVV
jgi:hypothetical protein